MCFFKKLNLVVIISIFCLWASGDESFYCPLVFTLLFDLSLITVFFLCINAQEPSITIVLIITTSTSKSLRCYLSQTLPFLGDPIPVHPKWKCTTDWLLHDGHYPVSCRNSAPKCHCRVSFLRGLLSPSLLSQFLCETDSEGDLSTESLLRRVLGIDACERVKEV